MKTSSLATFILTLSLPSICYGAAMPASEHLHMPHLMARYDLESYEDPGNGTFSLGKRRNVDVCRFINTLASCVVISSNGVDLVKFLARQIKDAANHKSCGEFSGTAMNGKVRYRYRSAGGDCDTTAEEKTIAGALEDHLKKNSSPLCSTQCLDLSHGGTWNGYLLIGPANDFDYRAYCGPSLNFNHCTSGGKYDLG